jgi:hypothetical protein
MAAAGMADRWRPRPLSAAYEFLNATQVGRSALDYLNNNKDKIRVFLTSSLYEKRRARGEPDWGVNNMGGITFQDQNGIANIIISCSLEAGYGTQFDFAATFVHEMVHARNKLEGRNLGRGEDEALARIEELNFYLQSGERGLAVMRRRYNGPEYRNNHFITDGTVNNAEVKRFYKLREAKREAAGYEYDGPVKWDNPQRVDRILLWFRARNW